MQLIQKENAVCSKNDVYYACINIVVIFLVSITPFDLLMIA